MSCPGFSADGATTPTPQLLTAVLFCSLFGMCFMYWYFTMPVLTDKEEADLRIKLSMLDVDAIFQHDRELSLATFSELMDESHGALTEKEIAYLFYVVDDDSSNSIDRTELLDYITDKGIHDIEKMPENKSKMESRATKTAALSASLGGVIMKFKILITYTQCMSLLPVVFSLPFPPTMVMLMKLLEFSSLDIYVVFGEVSCHMYTGFKQKFIFPILLIPVIALAALIVYKIVLIRRNIQCSPPRFTEESVKTRVYTLGSLVAYGLYTGISTRIFRVFKCDKVQDRYYLTADYSVECYDSNWWTFGSLAIVGMFVYVIGIPLVQFIALWKNHAPLHESSALDQQAHRLVKKQFGSLYGSYTEECFYFELIDLFRRLMMTAGLILVRQSSVVQALLGAMTSLSWLLLVAIKFPYKAYWDNVLQIVLSSALLFALISGLALKLFRLDQHRKDDYEQAFFDVLLILLTAGCIALGILGLAITLPCCADRFAEFVSKRRKTTTFSTLKSWTERQRVVVKWLTMKDMENILALTEQSLNEKAHAAMQATQKTRRKSRTQMSVVHPASLREVVSSEEQFDSRKSASPPENEGMEPSEQQVLVEMEDSPGDFHPNMPASVDRIAKQLLEKKKTLGATHPSTLTSLSKLAGLLKAQGKHAEAEPLYRRALEDTEETFASTHPHRLRLIGSLARLLKAQGKVDEAEPLYRRASEGMEETLGALHPETLASVNNLAGALKAQGKLAEAERLCRHVLAGKKETLGATHPGTLTATNNLAGLLKAQGKLAEAEPLYRCLLEGRESTLGAMDPRTLGAMDTLASLLRDQNKLEEAELLCERASERREETQSQTLTSSENLPSPVVVTSGLLLIPNV